MGVILLCSALSSTNPWKGAHPVPGPMRIRGSDAAGGGRQPLLNHAGIKRPIQRFIRSEMTENANYEKILRFSLFVTDKVLCKPVSPCCACF